MKLTHAALLLSFFLVGPNSGQRQPDSLAPAKSLERTKDLAEQKRILLEALAQTPERNARTAAWSAKLGSLLQIRGEFAAAQVHLLEALAIFEVEKVAPMDALPNCLHDLAVNHVSLSQGKQAEAVFLRAIRIYDERFGRNSPYVTPSLESLAAIYVELGRFAESRALLDRSQDLLNRFLQEEDPAQMIHLSTLGRLEMALGHYTEAGTILERARSIGRKRSDSPANHLARALSLLGMVRYYEGNLGRAEAHWREAMAIGEANRDPVRFTTALSLSQLLIERRNWAGAEALIDAQREFFEKSLGPGHTVHAQALDLMGRIRMGQRRWAEAERLFRDSLQMFEQATGHNGIHIAYVRHDLGLLYLNWHRPSDACAELEEAISSTEKMLGPAHSDLVDYLENYSICLRHLGKSKEAKAAQRRSAAIKSTRRPDNIGIVDLSALRR